MSKTTIRADGDFGKLYTKPHDVRRVIAEYMTVHKCGYRQVWAAWFAWALGEK